MLLILEYNGQSGVGAAYIYELFGTQWTMTASILSPSAYLQNSYGLTVSKRMTSNFGYSVAIYGDYALIGAPVYSK